MVDTSAGPIVVSGNPRPFAQIGGHPYNAYSLKCQLLAAIINHDLDATKSLIEQGADVNALTVDGSNALHVAIRHSKKCADLGLLRIVIEHVKDINSTNDTGENALHIATRCGNPEVVQILLANGANVHTKNRDGSNCLHIAAESYSTYDTNHDKPEQIVKILIKCGVEINARKKKGFTPLHVAIENAFYSWAIVEILLKNGADVNAKSRDGTTPLFVALSNLHLLELKGTRVISDLVRCGADINQRMNGNGFGALHFACASGFIFAVRTLLNYGAIMQINDATHHRQETPLDVAHEYLCSAKRRIDSDRIGAAMGDQWINNIAAEKYYGVCKEIKLNIIKLKVAGYRLHAKNEAAISDHHHRCNTELSDALIYDKFTRILRSRSDKLPLECSLCEHKRACQIELEAMKSHMVSQTSLYDTFTTDDLDGLLTRQSLNALHSIEFSELYPIYCDLIVLKLRASYSWRIFVGDRLLIKRA